MERSTVYLYYTEVLLPVSIVLHDVASSSPLPPSSSVVKGHLTCHLLVVLIIYLLISAKRDGWTKIHKYTINNCGTFE